MLLGSTDGGARIELAIWHVMRMLPGPSPLAGLARVLVLCRFQATPTLYAD